MAYWLPGRGPLNKPTQFALLTVANQMYNNGHMPISDGTGLPSKPDETELESFRQDLRQLEADIQSYFRAYCLSGIAGFLAWLLGTKSASPIEIVIGNGGYNIYALMAIALLNMVTTTFLIYKGIAIHEIA